MVAKSFQKFEMIGEVYTKNNRQYIKVRNPSTGTVREVRWYSASEYAKMYPEEVVDKTKDPYYKPQKDVLGFQKGYITIFRGVKEDHEPWFGASICRYARHWGWYVISTEEVPADLPSGVEPVKLYWDPMGKEDGWLKDEETIKAHVRKTLLGSIRESIEAQSKPQGAIGVRLDLTLTIFDREDIKNERYNNTTFIYSMKDAEGNQYKWKTSAREWDINTTHHLRGTVKDYEEADDNVITVLTRCIES